MTALPFTPSDAESLRKQQDNPIQFKPYTDFQQ